jgi:hypothetical protein
MLECITMPASDQVFTHVDPDTKVNTVFAVTRIREHCLRTCAQVYFIPLDGPAAKMILHHRGIEKHRLVRAANTQHYSPLLFLDMPDGTQLLIDGSHTYLARFARGDQWCPAYIVKEDVWRDFIVIDFPTHDMSEAELLSSYSGIRT